jgi:hypothetical protein
VPSVLVVGSAFRIMLTDGTELARESLLGTVPTFGDGL